MDKTNSLPKPKYYPKEKCFVHGEIECVVRSITWDGHRWEYNVAWLNSGTMNTETITQSELTTGAET